MWQPLAFSVTSSALVGCSLIYSPNNLPAVIDAPDEIILDADPKMLVIDDVAPSTIYEGQGDLGSQPALVVLHGHHIINNTTVVDIRPKTGTAQLVPGEPVIAKNGNWIAIPVTAHVDPLLTQGTSVALDVTVTEAIPAALGGGMSTSTLSNKLTLIGLKELTQADVSGNTIDTTLLAERYSQVDLSEIPTVTFNGDKRAIIVSTSSITAKALTANGADGSSTAGGGAAVGGCAGGGPSSTGGCDSSIGGKGGSANGAVSVEAGGGGGGGFATEGVTGSGTVSGVGGSRTGDELIVTYDGYNGRSSNRAGGGGGGGKPLVGGNGGGGGAGGGSIELTAGGNVSVGPIAANGGGGAAGGSAGGGGGAGGVVMLRAGGSLSTSGAISVAGGLGGTSSANGGAGSDGRVRWDVPSGTQPMVPKGTVHRGPAFTLATRIFRTPNAMISLSGTPNDRFNVYSIHADVTMHVYVTSPGQQGVSFSPDGTAAFMQTLQQGFTHLCITLEGGKQGTPEADKCVDVAFLP